MMRLWLDRTLDRIRVAWNTLTDASNKQLLLHGPLPLWMEETFEREASRQGVGVGEVIFSALRAEAEAIIRDAAEVQ